jgi:hypothetical protein
MLVGASGMLVGSSWMLVGARWLLVGASVLTLVGASRLRRVGPRWILVGSRGTLVGLTGAESIRTAVGCTASVLIRRRRFHDAIDDHQVAHRRDGLESQPKLLAHGSENCDFGFGAAVADVQLDGGHLESQWVVNALRVDRPNGERQ